MASQCPIKSEEPVEPPVTPDGTATQSDADSMMLDSLLSNDIVTILVGPEEVKQPIHKNILIATSEFFKSVFSGIWENDEDATLNLHDDDPRAFRIFVGWAYAQPIAAMNALPVKVLGPPSHNITFRDYCSLYILAEQYLVESLQNEVLDIVLSFSGTGCKHMASAAEMKLVYENTPPHSKLRRCLVLRRSLAINNASESDLLCNGDREELMKSNGELAFNVFRETVRVVRETKRLKSAKQPAPATA